MDAILGYVLQEIPSTRRVLERYRTSPSVLQAFDRGVQRRQAVLSEAEAPR